ncbi:ExbD/TolR family protein [Ruegeria arenilitoris]|uniref:ExbD/TolR family protein n=1 Tax=Ruegeria arenilitoris TaxID=1173585 RepID=UPI00147DD6CE|nr:biopolymer transporter ExbD [Ruegeria arenilitoris]
MNFSDPSGKPRPASILPMINVVFLLLIFFLMTANLIKPEPFEVTPPKSTSDTDPKVERVLYVDKTGRMSFEGEEGNAALVALATISETNSVVQVRADAQLEAKVVSGLLRGLAQAGLNRVELVVARK